MRFVLFLFIFLNFLFANSTNMFLINEVKSLIQKEEYIALAINKYILQTAQIPKKSDGSLDWDKMLVEEYLGKNFNKQDYFTKSDIVVEFDSNNSCFIKGFNTYNEELKYIYNFYNNRSFRVNTIPPSDIKEESVFKGSQVLYGSSQKELVKVLNSGEKVLFPSSSCSYDVTKPLENYFYEFENGNLTYKYCKGSYSFDVTQEAPIYVENWDDLKYIKAKIGDIAYVQKNGEWFEYYFQGRVNEPWIATGEGEQIGTSAQEEQTYINKVLQYIPNAKDLFIRQSGGCMLSNGDIYCWGNNNYNRIGISSYGQLDATLTPNYINTPIMLKTQIDDAFNSIKWYNNPYRIKFEKMSMNNTNVCGVSTIFEYSENNIDYKYGGDLYCNGQISSDYYEDLAVSGLNNSSILKKNRYFYTGKSDKKSDGNEIYLKEIAMVDDAMAVLTETGKIYVMGKNYKGSLGIGSDDNFYQTSTPILVSGVDSVVFKKVFALRDTRTFGAIDSNNLFYIWGERAKSYINKPTLISSKEFDENGIFVNTNEFILRDLSKNYYKTNNLLDLEEVSSSELANNPISISYYKDNKNSEYMLYIDENLNLKEVLSSSLLSCKQSDETTNCDTSSNTIFDNSLGYLNSNTNNISDKFANFTNVSIFKLDHVIQEIDEDFENFKPQESWSKYILAYGGSEIGGFLGMFTGYSYYSTLTDKYDGTTRSFDFGNSNANQEVKITFDFYEIDSWDGEYFKVFVNDSTTPIYSKQFYSDSYFAYDYDGGTSLDIASSMVDGSYATWYDDEKHKITITTRLDSSGKLQLKFTSTLNENVLNESWGIDNLKVEKISNQEVLSFEDFNSVIPNGWGRSIITYAGKEIGNVLGMFTGYYPYTKLVGLNYGLYGYYGAYHGLYDGTSKTFDFGISNANQTVTVSFDFYEIDAWNGDFFKVYANEKEVFKKQYYTDSYYNNDYDGGVKVEVKGSSPEGSYYNWYHDEKHQISFTTTLDSAGKVKLEFFANFDSYILKESWAMDNLTIKRNSDSKILIYENFEGEYSWSNNTITSIPDNGDTTQVPATTFLGKFPIVNCVSGVKACDGSPFVVTKKYSFGSSYANYEVEIEFDFYEIDTWDGERFEFYANDELLAVDHFVMDGQQYLKDSNITGIDLQDNISPTTSYISDQTYRYKLRTKLNSSGDVTLRFQTSFEKTDPLYANYWSQIWYHASGGYYEDVNNESWGIDNIKIKLKETDKKFVCAMTGIEEASQMYCWGNVARSIPILSTSLYDVSKISTINKLFISQDSEKTQQMSFDEFFNNGKLFLKYPTYIGGFDYPFYFK